MNKEIKTPFGAVSVRTENNVIEISLASSEQHPGNVPVVVKNQSNGDTARLIWIK